MEKKTIPREKYIRGRKGTIVMVRFISWSRIVKNILITICAVLFFLGSATATTLSEVREKGILRHLGIRYAHFVIKTESGIEGLDVELMKHFAEYLGVKYSFVMTTWADVFNDLTGNRIKYSGDDVRIIEKTEVRGDVISTGMTMLPWRKKIVTFSVPTFPTGIWVMARADCPVEPILPGGDIDTDIRLTREKLRNHTILTMRGTCISPELYNLEKTGAKIIQFPPQGNINQISASVISGKAEMTLLDIPGSLIALQKWPGKIKVIGPISKQQAMGVAFTKSSNAFVEEFNRFFKKYKMDGKYKKLVEKYYPAISIYMGDFFNDKKQ